MTATTRREAAERSRQHIRDVATHLFASHGFAATTTKQIAREAGVAEGLLFHYFPRKLDLLRTLHDEPVPPLAEVTATLAAADPADVRGGLQALSRTLLSGLRAKPDLMAVLAAEGQLDGELGHLFWQTVGELRGTLAGWLDRSVSVGALREDTPTATVAATLTATLSFLFLEHRREPEDLWQAAVDAQVDALVDTLVQAWRAAP